MVTIAEPQVTATVATPAQAAVAVTSTPQPHLPAEGVVLPTGPITFEEYLEKYAAHFYEFVNGEVIPMSPVRRQHSRLSAYLDNLLEAYFSLRPIGELERAPFLMRLPNVKAGREPDLQVILNEHLDRFKDTYVDGPCDICIEIVSPESVARDHGEKFAEYALGGVPEYWIIDPLRNEGRFYRLDEHGIYIPQPIDKHGNYRTPALPGFVLPVLTLWLETLPNMMDVFVSVRAMLDAETPNAD